MKLSLGKLHILEVAIWENTLGKLPLRKNPLGKYLASLNSTLFDFKGHILSSRKFILLFLCFFFGFSLFDHFNFMQNFSN